MVGWQVLPPTLWKQYRSVPVPIGDAAERHSAMEKLLRELWVENRDNNISRKRVPFRNRHVAAYKEAMRKGNLSQAAWALNHLGVSADQLNAVAVLLAVE